MAEAGSIPTFSRPDITSTFTTAVRLVTGATKVTALRFDHVSKQTVFTAVRLVAGAGGITAVGILFWVFMPANYNALLATLPLL